jgi:hypothetical protein
MLGFFHKMLIASRDIGCHYETVLSLYNKIPMQFKRAENDKLQAICSTIERRKKSDGNQIFPSCIISNINLTDFIHIMITLHGILN